MLLQAVHIASGPSWSDIAGPVGGFVVLTALAFFGGKGFYRLAMYAIESARGFGAAVITEWRRSNDEMRSWMASHAAEEVAVLREISNSLHDAAVERERSLAQLEKSIAATAKETRHDVRNSILVLAERLREVPGFNDTEPPPTTQEREDRRARDRG